METIINRPQINKSRLDITIVGDGDLILNKMNAITERQLLSKQANKAKALEAPNDYEIRITSMHWYDGTPEDYTEKGLYDALKNNKPCITAFGLKKSFGDAVVRNEIDKYKTKFDANVNIVAKGGLVPISFSEYHEDEKLISARKGSPVRSLQNRFCGWTATFTIEFMENIFSAEQIVTIIDLAGFGLGIGSGRSSGFGRYHVSEINIIKK